MMTTDTNISLGDTQESGSGRLHSLERAEAYREDTAALLLPSPLQHRPTVPASTSAL